MAVITLPVKRLPNGRNLPLPAYATPQSSGMDLYAAVTSPRMLQPRRSELIPTGISMAMPDGMEAQVRSRSGLAAKNGIFVLNSPGTIDADYRGEISVLMYNASDKVFLIERGMKIAQLVIAPVFRVNWAELDSLGTSERGASGFGSTGVR